MQGSKLDRSNKELSDGMLWTDSSNGGYLPWPNLIGVEE